MSKVNRFRKSVLGMAVLFFAVLFSFNCMAAVSEVKNFSVSGINGGVLVSFKSVKGAKRYVVYAKDYKGKTHKCVIPKNVNNGYKHEYDKYYFYSGSQFYLKVLKLDHNYKKINTWMNKNEKIYWFKVIAYNKASKGKQIASSKWKCAMPFNVEKDAPAQDVNVPGKDVNSDPENAKSKQIYTKRFKITKVREGNKAIYLQWTNTVPGFEVSSYEVKYKLYYQDDKKNKKTKYKTYSSGSKNNYIRIGGLKNECEYIVSVTAEGTIGKNKVYMVAEEIVIPHTKATRYSKRKKVNTSSPYQGGWNNREYYKKNVAEAYANYGNNGKPFKSNTKYFLWCNLHQLRLYIFSRTETYEWKLVKDMPCGIGADMDKKRMTMGQYILSSKDWVYIYSAGALHVQWLTYYGGYYGNAIHTETYETMENKMLYGKFESAGCIRIDRVWAKWIYDRAEGSKLLVR